MYALLEIRGKQYKVKENSTILVPGWEEIKPEEVKSPHGKGRSEYGSGNTFCGRR